MHGLVVPFKPGFQLKSLVAFVTCIISASARAMGKKGVCFQTTVLGEWRGAKLAFPWTKLCIGGKFVGLQAGWMCIRFVANVALVRSQFGMNRVNVTFQAWFICKEFFANVAPLVPLFKAMMFLGVTFQIRLACKLGVRCHKKKVWALDELRWCVFLVLVVFEKIFHTCHNCELAVWFASEHCPCVSLDWFFAWTPCHTNCTRMA